MNIEDEITFLEKKAKLKLTSVERKKFVKDLREFKKGLKLFDSLDLSNVKESITPFLIHDGNNLRDDEIIENKADNFFENSSNSEGDYIVLEKGNIK